MILRRKKYEPEVKIKKIPIGEVMGLLIEQAVKDFMI
jgi:hypothetical protein